MDIPINAKASCSDGPCGQLTHLILMPTTEKITHLVISNGLFPETEYIVPVDQIAESTAELIRLNCTREELSKMPVFDRVEFIPSNLTGFTASPYMMWPYYVPDAEFIKIELEHIPANELAIRRGAGVEATDGRVGRVDEFLINPDNDHITHLVLREGHLWGQKDVTIPVSLIDHYDNKTVYLKSDKHGIEGLPAIPVRRGPSEKK
jgi:sporulation protein YlmC with PRC-barrel domain